MGYPNAEMDKLFNSTNPLVEVTNTMTNEDGSSQTVKTKGIFDKEAAAKEVDQDATIQKQMDATNAVIAGSPVNVDSSVFDTNPLVPPVTDKIVVPTMEPTIPNPEVTQPGFDESIVSDSTPSTEVEKPVVTPQEVELIKNNPSAVKAISELKGRVDADPETKQEEYMAFLRETGQLKEWRPDLFKALTSAAIAVVAGGDPYQSVVDTLGYEGEEQEKIRLEEREDEQAMIKLLMDNSANMPATAFIASLDSMKSISPERKAIIRNAFASGQRGTALEKVAKAAEAKQKAKNRWYDDDMKFIKAHVKDEQAGSRIASQLNATYNYLGDRLSVDWEDDGVHASIAKGLIDSENQFKTLKRDNDGWFGNEELVKVNLLGNVLNNFVVHTSAGAISRQDDSLKNANDEDHAYLIDWMFKKPKGERGRSVSAKLTEWKGAREGHTEDWDGYNNFALWLKRNSNSMDIAKANQ